MGKEEVLDDTYYSNAYISWRADCCEPELKLESFYLCIVLEF